MPPPKYLQTFLGPMRSQIVRENPIGSDDSNIICYTQTDKDILLLQGLQCTSIKNQKEYFKYSKPIVLLFSLKFHVVREKVLGCFNGIESYCYDTP